MTSGPPRIRPATAADMPALGRLGALLLTTHHHFDRERFMAPGADPARSYARFLSTQLDRDDVVILVAEIGSDVVGYVYGGIEPRSWKELREEAGFIHDIVVDEPGRGRGIAVQLLQATLDWLRTRGATRAMLWTAEANEPAHRLFARLGFRRTMVEMTREL